MGQRIFVAVVPPAEAVEHLDEFLEPRREHGAFRWSAPEQWHLTLAFLADVPERVVEPLIEGVGRAVSRRTPFSVTLAGGGAFPDPISAKVLYAALDLPKVARTELDRLAVGCRGEAAHAGVAVDGARFRPHLTLARLGLPSEVTRWLRILDTYRGPEWRVEEVEVIASHLGEGPRGRPRHESLASVSLGDGRSGS